MVRSGHQEDVQPFSSNAMRLSAREWIGLAAILLLIGVLAGMVWSRLERFEPAPHYRIPYALSEDYWHYERVCRTAVESDKTLVIGDSFVWGQYVKKEEALSSYLNQGAGEALFANTGLDGGHPLALEGLVRHHCDALRNRRVLLHLNLLWMSSREADLQLERTGSFNHPRLVPQFARRIPGYRAPFDERIGVTLARHFSLLGWPRHLQDAYLSGSDLARWTLEHPYQNPVRKLSFHLPEPGESPHPDAHPWFVDGASLQTLPWVELETSLQWKAFERLVATLESGGNSVFVLVGPLNEHMLESSSAERYRELLGHVEVWLREQELPHFIPPPLPSHLYADLSHPLGPGYAVVARDLWEHFSR
jgi:hypothetical protein